MVIPAFLSTRLAKGLILAAVVAAILALAYCTGRDAGYDDKQGEVDKALIEQAKDELRAGNEAAETRAEDAVADKEKELQDERIIASAPGGVVSPADRALACDRLRRAYPGSQLPASCGLAGGN